MLTLSAAEVRAALPMPRAIEAMREAFTLLAQGRADLPQRTRVPLPANRGSLLVMPARADVPLGLGVKVVSVLPGNAAAGRPVVQAVVVLLDAETGEVAAVLEGTTLTAIRTGAASGLATDLLARKDARRLAIIGAGAQARTQLEGVCAVRQIDDVTIWSRTRLHAEQFARETAAQSRFRNVEVAPSAAAAVGEADVICLATSARTPVVRAADLPPGAHVNAIGSFTPEMQEFEPALLGRARVVVDQREAAMAEAGEVIAAVKGGVLALESIVELGEVLLGKPPVPPPDRGVSIFKSVGLAVQDLSAAGWVVKARQS